MKTSDQIDKLLPDLFKVKKAITPLKKQSENPFFNSSYTDLNGVLDAVEPLLEANNFIILQPVNGKSVETMFLHSSGQWISSEMDLVLVKNDMQSLGSAVTYARRFSLKSLLSLKEVDDDGNAATHDKAPPQRGYSKPTPAPAKAVAPEAPKVSSNVNAPIGPSTVASPAPARKLFNKPAAPAAASKPVSNGAASAAEFD